MGRIYRYNYPVGHTCPDIDRVINFLQGLSLASPVEDQDRNASIDIMEELRTANSKLREWGEGLFEELKDVQDEQDDLESERDKLLKKIDELEQELVNKS